MQRVLNPKTGRKINDLTGDKIGRWTVVRLLGNRGVQTEWECQCSCGTVKPVMYGTLTSGHSESCGCLRGEQLRSRALKHGRSKSRLYHAWQQMRDRCYNEARSAWKHYGGRGITVCEKWNTSFEAFAADMGEPGYGESLDRFPDMNGNYEPGNCRWATVQEQASNRRDNVWFDWGGEKRTLTDIARMEGVAYCSFRNRVVQDKDTPEQAVAYCKGRKLKFVERAAMLLANPPQKRGKRRRPDITPRRQNIALRAPEGPP